MPRDCALRNSIQVDFERPADRISEPVRLERSEHNPTQVSIIINQAVSAKQIIEILLSLLAELEEKLEIMSAAAPLLLDGEKFLTQQQVATFLQCSDTSVKRLRLSGALAYRPGKPVLVPESALQAYIKRTTGRFVSCEDDPPDEISASRTPYERATVQSRPPLTSEEAASARARKIILLRQLAGPIRRERLSEDEKLRRAEFEKRKLLSKQRKAKAKLKVATHPKTP